MGSKSKKKRNKKRHISNQPHFTGLGDGNQPNDSGFSSHGAKDHKPIIRRTTSK